MEKVKIDDYECEKKDNLWVCKSTKEDGCEFVVYGLKDGDTFEMGIIKKNPDTCNIPNEKDIIDKLKLKQ